jgi:hypothetical protein
VKDARAMEEGSQIPSGPGPSRGRGGQLGVGAQTGVTREAVMAHLVSHNQESENTSSIKLSKRLRTSPRKKGRFNQKEPEGDTDSDRSRSGGQKLSTAGEPKVQTDIQAPGVGDDDEGNEFRLTPSGDTSLNSGGSASLSFSSDTEYLSDTYVISHAEVKKNGILETGSLLPPGATQAITLALDEEVVERTVFFPSFYKVFSGTSAMF